MIQPLTKFIFVKRFVESTSKIIVPDSASADSTLFEVLEVGPDVTNLKKGDICIMHQQAVAQQLQGGFVCNSEYVCAIVK